MVTDNFLAREMSVHRFLLIYIHTRSKLSTTIMVVVVFCIAKFQTLQMSDRFVNDTELLRPSIKLLFYNVKQYLGTQ